MSNPFSGHNGGLTAPASRIEPVTPDDDNDLSGGICRALMVGTAGSANLIDASGAERTGVPLLRGINPIGVQRLKTGGTAAEIWALY